MANDHWLDLVAKIKATCSNVEEDFPPLLDPAGDEIEGGELHIVEFDSPTGARMRLQRWKKPRVVGQHQSFSGRAGTAAQVTFEFSDNEYSDHTELLKEDEYGEWQSVPLENLG